LRKGGILRSYKAIFWDFDGVIKESLEIKGSAFYELFRPFGEKVAQRVYDHHLSNGGMSRMNKMPLYLEWAKQKTSTETVDEFCSRFGKIVLKAVVEAPWVPGVEAFLRTNPYYQQFFLVSATPQEELEEILEQLQLMTCFLKVFGSPINKADAIQLTLKGFELTASQCLMIGDAMSDLRAAEFNAVPFLLRRHTTNAETFSSYSSFSIEDFLEA